MGQRGHLFLVDAGCGAVDAVLALRQPLQRHHAVRGDGDALHL